MGRGPRGKGWKEKAGRCARCRLFPAKPVCFGQLSTARQPGSAPPGRRLPAGTASAPRPAAAAAGGTPPAGARCRRSTGPAAGNQWGFWTNCRRVGALMPCCKLQLHSSRLGPDFPRWCGGLLTRSSREKTARANRAPRLGSHGALSAPTCQPRARHHLQQRAAGQRQVPPLLRRQRDVDAPRGLPAGHGGTAGRRLEHAGALRAGSGGQVACQRVVGTASKEPGLPVRASAGWCRVCKHGTEPGPLCLGKRARWPSWAHLRRDLQQGAPGQRAGQQRHRVCLQPRQGCRPQLPALRLQSHGAAAAAGCGVVAGQQQVAVAGGGGRGLQAQQPYKALHQGGYGSKPRLTQA